MVPGDGFFSGLLSVGVESKNLAELHLLRVLNIAKVLFLTAFKSVLLQDW